MTLVLDVQQELAGAALGRRHWITVLILGLVTLFDGYDTFVPSYVIPYAIRQWQLPASQAGLLVSSGLIGFMIGSLAVGLIADRIGRKPTLMAGLLVASLMDLSTAAFGRTFHVFIVLRLLTGVGLGTLLPLAVTLVNEFGPRRYTNLLVGCVMIWWSSGGILAAVMGLMLAPRFGWPALFWVDGAALPLVAVCAWVLHESPRFLALNDRQPALHRVMSWLRPGEAQRYSGARFGSTEPPRQRGAIRSLLAPAVRRNTVIVWICAACSLFTIFGLSSWVPQSMLQRGESLGASFAFGALLQFTAVLGGVGCGWAADRLDRRWVLAGSWTLAALAIGALALINLHWSNLVFIAAAGFFVMGAQPVLNNLTASLYETRIKSTGVGVELGVGRLGGILGPYAGGWLKQLFPGTLVLFSSMAVAVALCAAGVLLLRAMQPVPLNR